MAYRIVSRIVSRTVSARLTSISRALALLLSLLSFAASGQTKTAPRSSVSDAAPGLRATRHDVDASLPDDARTLEAVAPYSAKVRALENVIGTLAGELKKTGLGAGTLGNLVTDAMRARASEALGHRRLLAVTNGGGLRRSTITAGELRARDVYELLPFENALIAVDLTGEQLSRFLQVVLNQRDAQSGVVVTYRPDSAGQNQFVEARLIDERNQLDPAATYTVITIDYLLKRGGDYAILQEAKNMRPLNVTLRDALLDYIKGETSARRPIKAELDGRFAVESAAVEKN